MVTMIFRFREQLHFTAAWKKNPTILLPNRTASSQTGSGRTKKAIRLWRSSPFFNTTYSQTLIMHNFNFFLKSRKLQNDTQQRAKINSGQSLTFPFEVSPLPWQKAFEPNYNCISARLHGHSNCKTWIFASSNCPTTIHLLHSWYKKKKITPFWENNISQIALTTSTFTVFQFSIRERDCLGGFCARRWKGVFYFGFGTGNFLGYVFVV